MINTEEAGLFQSRVSLSLLPYQTSWDRCTESNRNRNVGKNFPVLMFIPFILKSSFHIRSFELLLISY